MWSDFKSALTDSFENVNLPFECYNADFGQYFTFRDSQFVEYVSAQNTSVNRPFPSSLVSLFQSESKCETFHMKMSSARGFFFMQIKVIFIRMVLHLDLL